jgi:hypothetical protein
MIRFRVNIHVTDADGQTQPAAEWVGKGRACSDAARRARHHEGPAGRRGSARACQGHEGAMVSSEQEATAATLVNHYAKRWTIEPQFRDTKDLRFGMGLSSTRIGDPMPCAAIACC